MLWAVTSYFNFAACPQRRANYHTFRALLGLPLLTVEVAAPGAAFELPADAADILLRVRGDVMFQKECSWNLGCVRLPNTCDRVVFLDCDVVFPMRTVWAQVAGLLQDHAVVQPYVAAEYLHADGTPAHAWPSIAAVDGAMFARGDMVSHGLAWAFRREAIAACGFYDRLILGGADVGLTAALWRKSSTIPARHDMSPVRAQHFLAWAAAIERGFPGRVGVCSGVFVKHLWHGSEASRQYDTRKALLRDFRPDDVQVNADGVLSWAENADPRRVADIAARVRAYFDTQCAG